ncbi:LAMI_0E08240g1_1 [Lachancea mirantina]|uniref:LAMI_0E08240g1_1 n=1 Tax=Lachancea mirantina TaxID=1230905 RepID=A0A1G4JN71_9SACH|nr:LAMI_0E08240g1_1 [Lachancea mirantina]
MSFNETFDSDSFNKTNGDTFEPISETKSVSFYTPMVYVSILLISLVIFASRYRRKTIKELSELPSMFDESVARDLYFEIQGLAETGESKVHEKVVKAALLNRGAEAIRRTLKLKESEPQITVLYKNGSVGEEYWKRYQNEVKLTELEFKECIQEAEKLQPGWAQLFVAISKEICFNQAMARRYESILTRKEVNINQWALKLDDNGKLVD